MKNYSFSPYSGIIGLWLFLTCALLFTSCADKDQYPLYTELQVIHAIPNGPGVDIYIDSKPDTTYQLSFAQHTPYLELVAGQRNIRFVQAGFPPTNAFADLNIPLAYNQKYTLALANTTDSLEFTLYSDNIASFNPNLAYVRFIHFSPDAPAVAIRISSVTQPAATNLSFKDASSFISMEPRSVSFSALVDSTVLVQSPSVFLSPGSQYTFYLTGFANPADENRKLQFGGPF